VVLSTGAYSDPAWLVSLAGPKVVGDIPGNSSGFNGPLGGDIVGHQGSAVVAALQGFPLSIGSPLIGQALVWDGAHWTPNLPGAGSFINNGNVPQQGSFNVIGSSNVQGGLSVGSSSPTAPQNGLDVAGGFANQFLKTVSLKTDIPGTPGTWTSLLSATWTPQRPGPFSVQFSASGLSNNALEFELQDSNTCGGSCFSASLPILTTVASSPGASGSGGCTAGSVGICERFSTSFTYGGVIPQTQVGRTRTFTVQWQCIDFGCPSFTTDGFHPTLPSSFNGTDFANLTISQVHGACAALFSQCSSDADCCSGICNSGVCNSCAGTGATCFTNSDCCGGCNSSNLHCN
jgi:hypothetical protein